jgi:predicted secreted hydrolase
VSFLRALISRRATALVVVVVLILALIGSAGVTSASALRSGPQPLVHFPADQAGHPSATYEWWYAVGHLKTSGRTFGYEVTIFKIHHALLPGLAVPASLFRTDIAITDEGAKRFHHRVTYYFPGAAHVSTSALDVHVGTASLAGATPQAMTLKASIPSGVIDLRLSSLRPVMRVGGRGYLAFGDGYTYYYSLTDLRSRGELRIGGHRYRVSGISWLDHQWGKWSWSSVHGWTWMALQLSNGVQLSVFDFRWATGSINGASVLLTNGHSRTIRGTSIMATGSWKSPHSHAVYPFGWVVRIPGMRAVLRVAPSVKDQEVYVPGGGVGTYWEGSGRITGTWGGSTASGLSYTELTGYAGGLGTTK